MFSTHKSVLRPVILGVAPNGSTRRGSDHPALPLMPAEQAACARQVASAGASLMHLHVRDERGRHSLDAGRYREVLAAIREAVGDDLVLQVSSEAGGRYTREQQMQLLRELRPESASVALRELCPGTAEEPAFGELCAELRGLGVLLQHVLYEPAEVLRFEALRARGALGEERPFALFVLGRSQPGREGEPEELLEFLRQLRKPAFRWAVCCFGRREPIAGLLAARRGGHVRVGFENNLWLADGSLATGNAALLAQLQPGLADAGCRPASANEARAMLQGR